MFLVYLCIGMTASLSMFQLVNTENILTDWNTGDGGFKWRTNCDFSFYDIGKIPITTATREECGRFCIANPQCSHFTFGYLENCYMKKAPSTTVRRDFDYESIGICGFIPWRLDSETGRDGWNSSSESDVNKCRFYGNDKVVITTDCQQDKDCSFWYDQVLPTNGSACKLIDGSSGFCCPAHINKMNAENVPTDWNTGKFGVKWQSNCDFYGDDIGSIQISFEHQNRDSSGKLTEEQCSGWCVANPQCSHFRLHEQICFMKKKPLNSQHTSINSGLCGFVPWRFDSASVFLESSDWKQNGVNCEIYGNDNLIYTTQCREALRCTEWYENVRPTNGSTDCKLVDGSSGSCCPEILQYQTQHIEMIPNVRERIIDAGSTLTLTCDYAFENVEQKNNFNISWEIPNYLSNNVELSDLDNRLRKTFGRNETHMTSTLSLTNTRPKDTGYFGCRGPRGYINTHTVNQYVYVFSSAELVIIEGNEYYIQIPHGKTDHPINCRPTHPDIKVSLIHGHQYTARGENWLEPKSDLLADPNSNWSFEPKTGLKLKKAKIDDNGIFKCTGTYKTQVYSRDIFLYVGGMELNRTDGVEDPVEGSNVNLMCRTYVYTASFSPPKWSYQVNGIGLIATINKTNQFEGIEIKEPDIFVYKDKTLHTSQLSLTNISPSSYTFQCQGSGFTEKISFQPKKLEGNLKSKYVQLKKNIAQNLTCFISRGSKGNRIIWLKDEKEYSGPVYSDNNSSILPLQGKAEEKGSYACLWKNNLVEENYVNFTVIAVPSIYPTSTETSVGHFPKSTTHSSIKHVPTSTETSSRTFKVSPLT